MRRFAVLAIAFGLLAGDAKAGTISGTITADGGGPLEKACATVIRNNLSEIGPFLTDANGNYVTSDLPAAEYRIRFSTSCTGASQANYVAEVYDNQPGNSGATSVNVPATGNVGNISAGLAQGITLSGKVTRASDGAALENAVVYIRRPDTTFAAQLLTNAQGEWSVSRIRAGTYAVESRGPNLGNYVTEFYDDKPTLAEAEMFTLPAGGSRSGLNAVLATAGQIKGSVKNGTNQAIQNVCVDARRTDGTGSVYRGITNFDGNYTITGVPTGSYHVYFAVCQMEVAGFNSDYAPEYWNDSPTKSTATPVSVTAGSDTTLGVANLGPGGKVSGTVTVNGGSGSVPVTDSVCANAYDADGNFAGQQARVSQGAYTIVGLPSGNVRIRFASCAGGSSVVQEYYDDKPDLASANPVAVTAGSTTPNINADLFDPDPAGPPPNTTIDSGPSDTVTETTATFTFSSDKSPSTFTCFLDGASGACTSPKTYTGLALGQHTFAVAAIDKDMQVDPTPAQRTWTIGTVASTPTPTSTPTATATATDTPVYTIPTTSPTPVSTQPTGPAPFDACAAARAALTKAQATLAKAKKAAKKAARKARKAAKKAKRTKTAKARKAAKKAKKAAKKAKKKNKKAAAAMKAAQAAVDAAC